MYKVIMVDDDYPVLEFMSEAIDWHELGYELNGLYENGAAALGAVREDPPDIVITDIGMPKMNGIELVRALKELKQDVTAIIITCHDEFAFAKQALQLNVHEYLLKETFVPEDLHKLLAEMKLRLDTKRQANARMERLQKLTQSSGMLVKQRFIRQFMHQPLLHRGVWLEEARQFGICFEGGMSCLPVIAYLDGYLAAKQRFVQEDTLMFAIGNLYDEVLQDAGERAVHFIYDVRRSFLLIPFLPSLKVSIYEAAAVLLTRLQDTLQRTLKLSMTFIIGHAGSSPEQLRSNILSLQASTGQRFYMHSGSTASIDGTACGRDDLFAVYNQALTELRELVVAGRKEAMELALKRWMKLIRSRMCEPELVKDWALKLLLDMKLKIHSLGSFRASYSADVLHKEAAALDTLDEIEAWLLQHCRAMAVRMEELLLQSQRSEIQQAYQYVERHLDRRITLDEVAGFLHLNASYFSRLFRKENGETFIEYVTRMKMNRAKELLDQTTCSVGKICEMLGYDNQSYFIKTFKGVTGVTPSEYRGRAREAGLREGVVER